MEVKLHCFMVWVMEELQMWCHTYTFGQPTQIQDAVHGVVEEDAAVLEGIWLGGCSNPLYVMCQLAKCGKQ